MCRSCWKLIKGEYYPPATTTVNETQSILIRIYKVARMSMKSEYHTHLYLHCWRCIQALRGDSHC